MSARYFSISFHGPIEQQCVADPELLRQRDRRMRAVAAVETERRQPELRYGTRLRRTVLPMSSDVGGMIASAMPISCERSAKYVAAQWQVLQCHLRLECLRNRCPADDKSISRMSPARNSVLAVGLRISRQKPLIALDRQNVGAGGPPQVQFLQILADKRRTVGYPQPAFTFRQLVLLYPRGEARAFRRLRFACRRQPPPRKDHVDDSQAENRKRRTA